MAARHATPQAPLGTFLVNIIGCVLCRRHRGGRRTALHHSSKTARAFLLIGVLGGFTTFSFYTYETFALLRDGRVAPAAFIAAGQVFVGLMALWGGDAVARAPT